MDTYYVVIPGKPHGTTPRQQRVWDVGATDVEHTCQGRARRTIEIDENREVISRYSSTVLYRATNIWFLHFPNHTPGVSDGSLRVGAKSVSVAVLLASW